MNSTLQKCDQCDWLGSWNEAAQHVAFFNGHTTAALDEDPPPRKPQTYICHDCHFAGTFDEWQEHQVGTGHHEYGIEEGDPEPKQLDLLAVESGSVKRAWEVPIAEGYLVELKAQLAVLVREKLDLEDKKKSSSKQFADVIQERDNEIRAIVKVLKNPVEVKMIDCEWRPNDAGTEKVLVRLDTDEEIERRPLSAEERAAVEAGHNNQ